MPWRFLKMDFIAGALYLWTNVETVHRTVSLSLLASQALAFAPISGPNPDCLYKNKINIGVPEKRELFGEKEEQRYECRGDF